VQDPHGQNEGCSLAKDKEVEIESTSEFKYKLE
jgi:hypothetical protein